MIQPPPTPETFSSLLKEDRPRPNSFFPLLSIAPADTTDPTINKASDEDFGNVWSLDHSFQLGFHCRVESGPSLASA